MRRYAFIYNPGAKGGRHSKADLEDLTGRIRQLPNAKLFHSQKRGDIPDLVQQHKADFDVFVACGGDGTAREVASSLISTNKILGILPLGSGNDLIKTLAIPASMPGAFDTLLKGRIVRMDVGRCNDFIFLNSLGFGYDGLANQYAHDFQWLPSFLRYTIAALKANLKHEQFSVEIQGGNKKSLEKLIMISFANGRVEGGSFWIAPDASVSDCKVRMVKIIPVNRFLIPFLLPLFLIKKPYLIPQVKSSELSTVKLIFDDTPAIHADGEIIDISENEFEISIKPAALKVICG